MWDEMATIKGFGSDNHSGVQPQIMQALIEANQGHCPSYGTDPITQATVALIQKQFESPVEVAFVFNGTAANVLALAVATESYQAAVCSDTAHLFLDECSAPEAIARCKLLPVPHQDGKIILSELAKPLIRFGDQHYAQPKVISITQPTELGTVYTIEEMKSIIAVAKQHKMYVHIDGARLVHAARHLNLNFAELTTHLGVDLVSFGGTKNGLMFGEAVIFINPALHTKAKFIRKQFLNLPSKSRFIAAQFYRFFSNNLWLEISNHSHQMAKYLEQRLNEIGLKPLYSVDANAVFVKIPQPWIKPLRKEHFFYVWDEDTFECRLMTSFDTKKEEINSFIEKMKDLKK